MPKTPELVTSILAGKCGDLASTPGPGIEQLSQLILGPFKYKVRVGPDDTPRHLFSYCDSMSLDQEIDTGSCKTLGAPPFFGGLG